MDLARAPRRAPLTARKKGSGYENGLKSEVPSRNLVPRAFPFLSLGRREKALAPGGLLCILIGQ